MHTFISNHASAIAYTSCNYTLFPLLQQSLNQNKQNQYRKDKLEIWF